MNNPVFRKVFESKTFYIIFSIVVSIALWTYVEYAENPDVTVPVSGINISFEGEDTLTDQNLIITGIDAKNVTARFTGKRNVVSSFSNSNISAYVDLSEIAESGVAGVYQLPFHLDYPDGVNSNYITVSASSPNFVTVTVERLITRKIQVRASNNCSVAEGYQADPLICDTDVITVSGPESIVETIDRVDVSISGEEISESFSETLDVVLCTEDGTAVDQSSLKLSQEAVTVTVPIKMVKQVALVVNVNDGNSATSRNTIRTVTPSSIVLVGDPEILESMNQIVVGTIDLTDFVSSYTDTLRIPVPNDVTNVSGELNATVKVEVLGMSSTKLSVSNISTKNLTEGYKVTIITQSLDVTLRGSETNISKITSDNISIVADLSNLGNTSGTFSVMANVNIDGYTGVDAIGDYLVTVAISELEE